MEYTIDAQNKKLGRVATEAAKLLMGKNLATFSRNSVPEAKVKIINASKADILNKKMTTKVYKTYSGYPGGLKEKVMKNVVRDLGYKEVFRKAIHGMLPTNKLRAVMMRGLTIIE
jgi:large subunit ribosomal protein L13